MSQDGNQSLIVVVCSQNWDTSRPPQRWPVPYLCLHFVLRILLTSYLFLAFEIMLKIEQCIIMKWSGEDA